MNRFQVGKMRNLVHQIDPMAYIAINEVADIFPATNLDEKTKPMVQNEEEQCIENEE